MDASLRESGILFSAIQSTLVGEKREQESFPVLFKRILRDELWRERYDDRLECVVKFDTFTQCVTTPPLEGLGTTLDLIKNLAHGDNELLDLIDRATVEKPGRRWDNETSLIVSNRNNNNGHPIGTTAQYAIRRLRKDAPEIHARVIAGELSPHAGMIEAGLRDKTISIPVDPQKASRAIIRHFSKDEIMALMAVLAEYCLAEESA